MGKIPLRPLRAAVVQPGPRLLTLPVGVSAPPEPTSAVGGGLGGGGQSSGPQMCRVRCVRSPPVSVPVLLHASWSHCKGRGFSRSRMASLPNHLLAKLKAGGVARAALW